MVEIPRKIASRQRFWLPGQTPPAELRRYAFPLAKERLAIASAASEQAAVDETAMSAKFVISTINADRVGDVVVPQGCYLENYRRSPVVFFGHQEWPLPIGKAEDPSGRLTVTIEPGVRIVSEVFFSQRSLEAAQIFALVCEGILRSTSIGFAPLVEPVRLDDEGHEFSLFPGFRFDKWELLEWSIVGVPCNPFCQQIREQLSRDRLAGQQIQPNLRKALEPLAAVPTPWANGWSSEMSTKKRYDAVKRLAERRRKKIAALKRRAAKEAAEQEWRVTPFADLPITDDEWNADGATDADILDEILGSKDGGDWERYKKAHLTFNASNGETPKDRVDYKLPFARLKNGTLTAYLKQVDLAAAVINGAREGVDLPEAVKKEAFDHAMRYYEKAGVPEDKRPTFKDEKSLKNAVKKEEEVADGRTSEPDDDELATLPEGASLAQEVIELVEGRIDGLEPEVRGIFEKLVGDLTRKMKSRYPDIDFGGEEEEETPEEEEEEAAEEDEETEEVLQNYRHAPRRRRKSLSPKLKSAVSEAKEALGELAAVEAGTPFSRAHKAMCGLHHKELGSALADMDAARDDVDADADEKGVDLNAISAALDSCLKSVAKRGDALSNILGRAA